MNKKQLKKRIVMTRTETSENWPHNEMVDKTRVLDLVNQLDDAEPCLYNIAGHMTDYYQAGTLSEKHLIELIDKELTAFYNKEKTNER